MNGDLAAQILEDSSYIEAFLVLYHDGQLEGIPEGIAAQADARKRPLSDRQIAVVRDVVHKFCSSHSCSICGDLGVDDISRYLEDGYCSYHGWQMDKDD